MNEPKRRGRPPKAKLLEQAVEAITPENVHQSEWEVVHRVPDMTDAAQAYALRVWNGQSPDVPRNERLRRVAKALEGQGLSMEGVELP